MKTGKRGRGGTTETRRHGGTGVGMQEAIALAVVFLVAENLGLSCLQMLAESSGSAKKLGKKKPNPVANPQSFF
jgi:hypothetical protein